MGDLSGGSDLAVGASAALARRCGKVYLYGTLGYAWFARDNFRGLELSDSQWTGLVVFEWRVKPQQSLLLQYLITDDRTNLMIPVASIHSHPDPERAGFHGTPSSDTARSLALSYTGARSAHSLMELSSGLLAGAHVLRGPFLGSRIHQALPASRSYRQGIGSTVNGRFLA